MSRLFLVAAFALCAAASAQQYHSDPRTAAIISEQRYQSGDGQFGAAYTQEDGTDFKEETDADGTRHGSYSYIDPTGAKKTVSYTAGKNGFQASGDHLPVAPPAPPQAAPQPQYQPQQQYRAAPQQQQQQQSYNAGNAADYDDGSYDPRYNDPGFGGNGRSNSGFSAPVHRPQPQPQYQQPQQQPQQPQYQPQPQHQPQYQQQQQQPQYQPQQQQQQQYQHTTQNPHRFQPPGKLSLNRTPDGFSYSFNKV